MILIDTNVLPDVLAKREPFYVSAEAIWSAAETGAVACAISAISFNNTYYVIRKYGGEVAARAAVAALRDIFTVVPLDAQIINLAIDSALRDFEDAIQLHSAVRTGARYLITRNPGDFATDLLSVVHPDEYLAISPGSEAARGGRSNRDFDAGVGMPVRLPHLLAKEARRRGLRRRRGRR